METPFPGVPGPRPKPAIAPALVEEIAAKATAIEAASPAAAGPLWGALHKVLLKAKADPTVAAHLVSARDVAGLLAFVRRLRGEPVEPPAEPAAAGAANPAVLIDPETLKSALRAFRKRLKLTRLDHESRLGVGPMTGGRKHDVDAIIPPREFTPAVWEALADDGKLRRAGGGFFQLVDDPGHEE